MHLDVPQADMAAPAAVEEVDDQPDRGPDQEQVDALLVEVEKQIDATEDRDRRRDIDQRRLERTVAAGVGAADRSEEHTSELQSLMRISYAVFCLKKKTNKYNIITVIISSTRTM